MYLRQHIEMYSECTFGLNVFIKDSQQAYCLLVVLQQIYKRDIHGILQNVHICQHKK